MTLMTRLHVKSLGQQVPQLVASMEKVLNSITYLSSWKDLESRKE